jgi:segregation and condensation protein A
MTEPLMPGAIPAPRQEEIPFAMVRGQPYFELPKDLYIPPDALEVILDAFEGPLDLLLYLIRRQNLDILDIPIAEITKQYVSYIELMRDMRFELAAEYLVMAAILAEIKSRLLLPKPPGAENIEEDPRAELVRRLQEYEQIKKAATDLDVLPRIERDTMVVHADVPDRKHVSVPPSVDMKELLLAFRDVLMRAELFTTHQISREPLSVRGKMTEIMERLSAGGFHDFMLMFNLLEGRRGVVVCFMAMLELAKEGLIEIIQDEPLASIYLRANTVMADADSAMRLENDADNENQESATEEQTTVGKS